MLQRVIFSTNAFLKSVCQRSWHFLFRAVTLGMGQECLFPPAFLCYYSAVLINTIREEWIFSGLDPGWWKNPLPAPLHRTILWPRFWTELSTPAVTPDSTAGLLNSGRKDKGGGLLSWWALRAAPHLGPVLGTGHFLTLAVPGQPERSHGPPSI